MVILLLLRMAAKDPQNVAVDAVVRGSRVVSSLPSAPPDIDSGGCNRVHNNGNLVLQVVVVARRSNSLVECMDSFTNHVQYSSRGIRRCSGGC